MGTFFCYYDSARAEDVSMNDELERSKEVENGEDVGFNNLKFISDVPASVLKVLLNESTYEGTRITVDDKLTLIENISWIEAVKKLAQKSCGKIIC